MEANRYRIGVRGQLSPRFADTFTDFRLQSRGAETELVGVIRDQAQLYGVLELIQTLGLELIRVCTDPEPDGDRG